MLQILLHSSKTMRTANQRIDPLGVPQFLPQAKELVDKLHLLSSEELARIMKISSTKAAEVSKLYEVWQTESNFQTPAIDAFIGDIYSGLQVGSWSKDDRRYAHRHLLILSGLYGALNACDGIMPYRLEMGYKLPDGKSLYTYWGDKIAAVIDKHTTEIINLSAVEYTKALLPYVSQRIITPKFLTMNIKTAEPTFVTVHAKIARGAFARWMIQNRVDRPSDIKDFSDLGYRYSTDLSTPEQPVFICDEFKGIGLSVRLQS